MSFLHDEENDPINVCVARHIHNKDLLHTPYFTPLRRFTVSENTRKPTKEGVFYTTSSLTIAPFVVYFRLDSDLLHLVLLVLLTFLQKSLLTHARLPSDPRLLLSHSMLKCTSAPHPPALFRLPINLRPLSNIRVPSPGHA